MIKAAELQGGQPIDAGDGPGGQCDLCPGASCGVDQTLTQTIVRQRTNRDDHQVAAGGQNLFAEIDDGTLPGALDDEIRIEAKRVHRVGQHGDSVRQGGAGFRNPRRFDQHTAHGRRSVLLFNLLDNHSPDRAIPNYDNIDIQPSKPMTCGAHLSYGGARKSRGKCGMGSEETVRLYLVREVEREAGWWSREFMRVLFTRDDGAWSHRVANAEWLPRGRVLPWRDKTLEEAKQRLLLAQDDYAYYEEPGQSLPE